MKIFLILLGLALIFTITHAKVEIKYENCDSSMWCSSCDDTVALCLECHHKAYRSASQTINGITFYTCTERTQQVTNCYTYVNWDIDDGICYVCIQGFYYETYNNYCQDFSSYYTADEWPCGEYCLSCSHTSLGVKGDCQMCYPGYVQSTTDATICGLDGTSGYYTGISKCKIQKGNTCLQCNVNYALKNTTFTECQATTNLQCGQLNSSLAPSECKYCYHGYIMKNRETCLLNSLVGMNFFRNLQKVLVVLIITFTINSQ